MSSQRGFKGAEEHSKCTKKKLRVAFKFDPGTVSAYKGKQLPQLDRHSSIAQKLELFRELNIESFRKLLKKYDKRRGSTEGERTFQAFRFPFDEAAASILENLEKKMVKLVGDRKRAMTLLRVPGLSQEKVKL